MNRRKIIRKGLIRLRLARRLKNSHDISSKKTGLPPGTLIYTGKKKTEKFLLSVIDYDRRKIEEKKIAIIEDCKAYRNDRYNSWINIEGIEHVKEVEAVGKVFGMDDMILEDLLNSHHRPKIEHFSDFLFLNIKMIKLKKLDDESEIDIEQVSFALGKGWLLSFQEEEGDVFEGIRKRLRNTDNELRKYQIDYLFYRLVDTIVDNYFIITEHIGDEIEELEDEMISDLDDDIRWRMQILRKDLIHLRKSVMPLREVMGSLAKEENEFVNKTTMRYFHDVYEHIIQLHEYIDSQRDMLSSLADLYLSGVSHKMNEVIKVLTVISTIFIPLTFIAGIYGMNFLKMPELNWEYGYLFVWTIMIFIVIIMLIFFRRKKWI